MASNTAIEWADHTINFWWGCDKVHEGCANCYAEAWSKRYGLKLWGPGSVRKRIKGAIPLAKKLNDKARREGVRCSAFSNSMSDLFERHEGMIVNEKAQQLFRDGDELFVPGKDFMGINAATLDDLRREAFDCIDTCSWIDWLLLTKRPQNVPGMWRLPFNGREPGDPLVLRRENVWLGTSISMQEHAEKQIPKLVKCRDLAPVLFLSIEPLLERLDLWEWLTPNVCNCPKDMGCECFPGKPLIDWVIVGGESGYKARPMHPQWVRDIRDQCQAAGVPFFFKQWGEWAPSTTVDGRQELPFMDYDVKGTNSHFGFRRVGKGEAGRKLDGLEYSEFPKARTHG